MMTYETKAYGNINSILITATERTTSETKRSYLA